VGLLTKASSEAGMVRMFFMNLLSAHYISCGGIGLLDFCRVIAVIPALLVVHVLGLVFWVAACW